MGNFPHARRRVATNFYRAVTVADRRVRSLSPLDLHPTAPRMPPSTDEPNVLVVSDHPLKKQVLSLLLGDRWKVWFATELADVRRHLRALDGPPVVVDLNGRSYRGLHLIERLAHVHPADRIVAVISQDDGHYCERLSRLDVGSCMTYGEVTPRLAPVLDGLRDGKTYWSPSLPRQAR